MFLWLVGWLVRSIFSYNANDGKGNEYVLRLKEDNLIYHIVSWNGCGMCNIFCRPKLYCSEISVGVLQLEGTVLVTVGNKAGVEQTWLTRVEAV